MPLAKSRWWYNDKAVKQNLTRCWYRRHPRGAIPRKKCGGDAPRGLERGGLRERGGRSGAFACGGGLGVRAEGGCPTPHAAAIPTLTPAPCCLNSLSRSAAIPVGE